MSFSVLPIYKGSAFCYALSALVFCFFTFTLMNKHLFLPAFALLLVMSLSACSTQKKEPAPENTTPTGTESSSSSTESSQARGTKTELANASTLVKYFKAEATMKVKSVTLDFMPNGEVLSDPKEDGKQFVRVELEFSNAGTEPFSMNYTNVTIDTTSTEGELITMLVNQGNVDDLLPSKELAQGESITGALYFEVPASETLDTLKVSYRGYEEESKEFKIALNQK